MKRDDYSIDKLRRAQARRQAVLDFLQQNPWAGFDAILAALPQWDAMHLRGAIANMLKKREIAASGLPRDRNYLALVTETETAENVRANYLSKKTEINLKHRDAYKAKYQARKAAGKAARAKQEAPAPEPDTNTWRGGSIVYRSGDNPDISRTGGGQGALRQRIHINCHQAY